MSQDSLIAYKQGLGFYTGTNGCQRDLKKAYMFFLKAAQLGDSSAMHALGLMYKNGEAVPQDYKQAVAWFLKAINADPNNKLAVNCMGVMCYYGAGTAQDYVTARKYFLRAAELGVPESMNFIGAIYEYAQGVNQDWKSAAEWYLKAVRADNKNRHAALNVARMYYDGHGVQKDLDKAFVYAEAATGLGYKYLDSHFASSCYLTGSIYLEHYKKYNDAVGHFLCAIKYGNIPEAWHNMGWMAASKMLPAMAYGKKSRIEKIDIDMTARYFYEGASNLGYVPSMAQLGALHIVYGDMKSAHYWLSKAAAKGYEPAIKSMKMLKTAAILNKISSWIPGSSSSTITNQINVFAEGARNDFSSKYKSNTIFQDTRGNHCTPGSPFYDAKGNLCEWGSPFYDFKGNYCTAGGTFYDSKGNYCTWGAPFYDAKGNYIVP